LSILDIDLYYKQNRDLHILKDAKNSVYLSQLHFDLKRSTLAIFLSEILTHCLYEAESNQALFDFLFHATQILDMIDKGIENFHLIFLIQLSKFLGIYPVNHKELSRYLVPGKVQLKDLLQYSLSDLSKLKTNPQNRSELLQHIIYYYRDHLEGMGELKSLEVLKRVFN